MDDVLPGFNKRQDGSSQEDLALDYLLERGYTLVERNFHLGRSGEIDLIMRQGPVLVFIEVKARRSHIYGLPEEAVTVTKRRRIRRLAEGYVQIKGIHEYEARFDVIAIDYATGSEGAPEIRHFIDAF